MTDPPPNLDARMAGLRMAVAGILLALAAAVAVTVFSALQATRPLFPDPAVAYAFAGAAGLALAAYLVGGAAVVRKPRPAGGADPFAKFAAETFLRAILLAAVGGACALAFLLTRNWVALAPAAAAAGLLVRLRPTPAKFAAWAESAHGGR